MAKVKYFKKLLILFSIFSLTAMALDFNECKDVITELFKKPHNQKKLQEYMKLQGSLTLHKLSWSVFQNDVNPPRLSLQKKILDLTDEIEKKGQADPQFLAVKKEFEQNPLSRKALANVMPYVSHILASQVDIEDAHDRKNFILNERDLKLLAILGEKEQKLASGKYNTNFVKDHNRDDSILNYAKLINSSMRNKELTPKRKENFKNRIKALDQSIQNLINSLDIPFECQGIVFNSCRVNDDQTKFSDVFLDFATKYLDFDQQKKLRYGDFWLDFRAAKTVKATGPPPWQAKQEEKVVSADKYNDFLINKVKGKYGYFLKKDWLRKNPKFLQELAKAMDENRDWVLFEGKKYYIPDVYNKSDYIDDGEGIGNIGYLTEAKAIQKAAKEKRYVPGKHCISKERNIPNLHFSIKGAAKHKDNIRSFHHMNWLCNAKTGEILPQTIAGFLSFPVEEGSERMLASETEEGPISNERQAVINDALAKGQNSYIYNGKAYYLSGAEVNKELPENHKYKTRPEVLNALANKQRFVLIDDKLVQAKNGKEVRPEMLGNQLSLQLNVNNSGPTARRIASSGTAFKSKWLAAVERGDHTFFSNGNEYRADDGKEYSRPDKIQKGDEFYIGEDELYAKQDLINRKSNLDVIQHYHRNLKNNKTCDHYTVIDKENAKLTVYSHEGEVLFQKEVITGRQMGDERTRWTKYSPDEHLRESNNQTGAGVYTTTRLIGPNERAPEGDTGYYAMYEGNLLGLEQNTPDAKSNVLALHQVPLGYGHRYSLFDNNSKADNRASGGCINLKKTDMLDYIDKFYQSESGKHQTKCDFYVLPTSNKHRFKIHKNKLVFTPKNRKDCDVTAANRCSKWVNYTKEPYGEKSEEILIEYNLTKVLETLPSWKQWDPNKQKEIAAKVDGMLKEFSSSLAENKEDIMKRTGLSNLEYNQLAQISIGILGVESEFGLHAKYQLKEALPLLVTGVKRASGDDSNNSRGPTQIKNVNDYYKQYGLDKIKPEELDDNPKEAARATMLVLADKVFQLKKMQTQNESVDFSDSRSTKETLNSLLYYIYQGKKREVSRSLATPAINPQARRIKQTSQAIDVYVKL